jgi:PAS domain S-box-containing protein
LATGQRHLNWQGTELTALRKNGDEFPVELSFGEMISNGHRVFTGFVRDISEKKRAEDELRRQKEVFQKIFENIPVTIAFVGRDGRIELVNPEWERTLGWTLEEIRKQNLDLFAEIYPDPQYRQMILDSIGRSTGEWIDRRVRVRDGRVLDLVVAVVHLSDGTSIAIGRNITERKRAEAELRESEARFRLVADSAPVLIWMSGTDKFCTYFNKPWLDFTGRSLDRELGNGWVEGVHPEDLRRCMLTYNTAFDRREAFGMEYRLRRQDGEFRWVLDNGVPRFNPDGFFAGYIGSCIDVTEQRRAEEQLHQAHADLARVTRMAAMGELAAAIAHEVNQPLTAIVTNANFSLRQLNSATQDPDELRRAITEIAKDGTRASAVISRIRGLLMSGAPIATDLDINQVTQDVIRLLRYELNRNRISLGTELASDLPPVKGDPVQLQQVLINLIMNAIESLRASADRPREIVIRSAKNLDGVLVQVEDSGPGIRPEQADRIFEPFFTTKPQGIGMGLSISRSIVESHGGRLWAAPGELHGVRFQFTVPMADTSDERAA